MTPPTPPGPRVLIAGGSITGLSLALMLEQAGIDFLVLEGGPTIAPQVGAGLAFFPGGARILDQLGLFERLQSISSVFDPMYDWRPDGTQNVCVRGVSPFFDQTLGYPVLFLDRQQAVQMFYEAIRQKGKIVTDARVARVHESSTSVTVTTTLGQSFTGTLLVGCDGVKSAVRSEMWRLGNASDPAYFGSGGPSEVRCKWRTLFGIAAVDDVPRSANLTMNQDFACALMSRGHYAYLVLHEALPRTLVGDEIRPYGADAVDEVARRHWDDPIREGVTFADVYGKLTRKVLVPIQEYVLQKWHFGRVLLLGDAVHKTHPSTGQGAMLCLEDNVVFTNLLVHRLKASSSSSSSPSSHQQPQPQPLTRADCDALFAETQRRRAKRAKTVSQESFFVVALYAWRNPVFRIMSRYILPLIMPDFILGVFMETTRPAPSLDHEYARAAMAGKKRDALVGFDDEDPGPKVPLAATALRSFTCLVLVMALVHAVTVLPSVLPSNGVLGGVRGPQSAVDTTALGIMAVVLVEGWRRCNIVSPIRFPWIWALLMDLYGVRVVGPLYLLVDILHGASQGRMRYAVTGHGVFISASKTMVPMLLVFGLAPAMIAWLGSGVGGMLPGSVFSGLFALPATLTAVGLSLYGFFSTDSDAVLGTRYRKHLRPGLACASTVLALLHLGARFGGLADAGLVARPVGYVHLPVLMWQLDVVADVALWCDVKSWALPGVLVFLGHGLVGPGASAVALWLWREIVLNGRPAGVRVRVVKA